MKKIALIGHGPGTANCIYPLISSLQKRYQVDLYAFHEYCASLWNTKMTKEECFIDVFNKHYDLIITGTGSGHWTEKTTPLLARRYGIATLSIQDLWSDIPGYKSRYENPPDFLVVIDDLTKKQLVTNYILHEKQILVYGNPHFDRLGKYTNLKSISHTPPYSVVAFSQCSDSKTISETSNSSKHMIESLLGLKQKTSLLNKLYITPHPREDILWLSEKCASIDDVFLCNCSESFDLLLECDFNVSINCTLQYESLIIKKPTIFFESSSQLMGIIQHNEFTDLSIKVNFDATQKVLQWITNYLSY